MPFDFSENTTARTLRQAAAYIEENGWCQDNFRSPSGKVCMLQALCDVGDPGRATLAINTFIDGPVIYFNDTPGRTKEEVIAALLGAADMVEANEAF